MPDILPKGKKPALRVNPRSFLIYSKPKVGKTEEAANLPGSMTLATEDGIEMYDANYLRIVAILGTGPNATTYYKKGDEAVEKFPELEGQIKTTTLENFFVMMNTEAARQKAANEVGHFPYKYGIIDTIDELETLAEVSATIKYKASTIGKKFDGKSVLELPQGGGYYHLRNEVIEIMDKLEKYFQYVIYFSHVKDKLLDKGGIAIEVADISLTGKLGQIVAARCDAIGYMYREAGKPKMISFESYETTGAMGARFPRLAGKRMEFKWSNIYINEGLEETPA